jgi:hypothetical protein
MIAGLGRPYLFQLKQSTAVKKTKGAEGWKISL